METYPLMESFVIEVDESWTELDIFKSAPTKRYTTVESLGKAYPNRSDSKLRDYYAIDLKSLLDLCYQKRTKEQRKSSHYPSSSSNDGNVLFGAVCRIKYKNEGDTSGEDGQKNGPIQPSSPPPR